MQNFKILANQQVFGIEIREAFQTRKRQKFAPGLSPKFRSRGYPRLKKRKIAPSCDSYS